MEFPQPVVDLRVPASGVLDWPLPSRFSERLPGPVSRLVAWLTIAVLLAFGFSLTQPAHANPHGGRVALADVTFRCPACLKTTRQPLDAPFLRAEMTHRGRQDSGAAPIPPVQALPVADAEVPSTGRENALLQPLCIDFSPRDSRGGMPVRAPPVNGILQ